MSGARAERLHTTHGLGWPVQCLRNSSARGDNFGNRSMEPGSGILPTVTVKPPKPRCRAQSKPCPGAQLRWLYAVHHTPLGHSLCIVSCDTGQGESDASESFPSVSRRNLWLSLDCVSQPRHRGLSRLETEYCRGRLMDCTYIVH